MKKFAALFTSSFDELKNVRTITTAAVFAAVSVVLGYFTLVLGDYLKIGFSSVPNEFVYYMFGPVVGGCYGFFLDVVKFIARPTGAYFPGFTLSAVLGGVIYGSILYRRPLSLARVFAAKFAVILVCNVLLGTLWLSVMYGKGFWVLLPMRALKNLIMWPVESMIFYSLAKMFEAAGFFRLVKSAGLARAR